MFKRFFFLLIYFFLFIPFTARAQESTSFGSLDVELWPEYDRPEMLVIYKGILSPEVTLPVTLTFRIPVEAGEPNAVAVGPDLNSVADVNHTSRVNDSWQEVSFVAAMPAFQMEYYDPGLTKTGNQRSYTYTWLGDYAVDALTLQVQHPVGATGMVVSPGAGRIEQGGDGFTYNTIDLGSLAAGAPFDMNIDYQKSGDDLSVKNLEIQPSAPITPQAGNQLGVRQLWPWMLAVLGVLLIAGGGFWYWRAGRAEPAPNGKRRRRSSAGKSQTTGPELAVYCQQCGKRASPGDRFCRACGTRLRIE